MEKMKTVVCDDELPALELATGMLERTGFVEVVASCSSVSQALERVAQGGVDLLVLDIEMPELSGVDAAISIEIDPKPLLIFATAHPEYAAEAFGIDAIDYLLKPLDPVRVQHAAEKAVRFHELIHRSAAETGYESPPHELEPRADELRIQDGNRFHVIPFRDIVWIEAAGDYSLIHQERSEVAVRRSLTSLELALPEEDFLRIHRSTMISRNHLRQVRRLAKGEAELILTGDVKVKSSRSHKDEIDALVGAL